jgi:hypothetical protein
MYRDDVCAVCGESLPPDHVYCREHAATVDERLHDIGALLPRLLDDLGRLSELLDGIAEETWDYLAEDEADDPEWPPVPRVEVRADAEEVDVDVDTEPGYVAVRLDVALAPLLRAVAAGLDTAELRRAAAACAAAEGASSTHAR